jgi:hypothetical protein
VKSQRAIAFAFGIETFLQYFAPKAGADIDSRDRDGARRFETL